MKKGLEDKIDKVSLSSRVQSFEEVNRELTKVNDTLNALLEKTTQTSEVDTTEGTEGNPGDIKTILNSDKTYSFSIRTEDGWKTPFLENREIIFKSKNPSAGEIKKSIDEIESKSTDEAKKTIFDEKADKFIMPRADYDSGWFEIERNKVYITGGTTGQVPSGKAGVFASTAGNNIGIPELGFKITRPFTKVQIIYGPSGTTGFEGGLTTGFLFWSDVVQSKQYYNGPGGMGSFITIMSEDHVCLSTSDQYIFHMKNHGGIDIANSTDGHNFQTNAACKIRIWK